MKDKLLEKELRSVVDRIHKNYVQCSSLGQTWFMDYIDPEPKSVVEGEITDFIEKHYVSKEKVRQEIARLIIQQFRDNMTTTKSAGFCNGIVIGLHMVRNSDLLKEEKK